MSLTVGSLFSGIGGLDLGLERAGMEVRWQVENDEFCQRVLAKHWPDVPRYGDIRGISGADLEPVDVICGGFPCQPVSHAGRRRGEEDDRFLWPEMLRLICEVRPAYVVGENVFGLVTHNGGLLLSSIVADLEAEGFEVAPPVVFPLGALGAWHRRDRVWLLAHSRYNWRSPKSRKQQSKRPEIADRGASIHANTQGERLEEPREMGRPVDYAAPREGQTDRSEQHSWECEPDVGRMVHGLPRGVEPIRRQRIKALGNSVGPPMAELIGRHLIQSEVRL